MSRVAKKPIPVPKGVEVQIGESSVSVKGPAGQLQFAPHALVRVENEDGQIKIGVRESNGMAWMMAGTARALINNMVTGVSKGFERKLSVVGVGYRAQAQGQKLNLTLGFSHPVVYEVPAGIKVETPSQTDITIKGADRQKVGQVAADIRRFRPPEPYKGKGVRFAGEKISLKQAKKK
jgi:large subunit ribosomal protein L6